MRSRLICCTPCSSAGRDNASPTANGKARARAAALMPGARSDSMRPGTSSMTSSPACASSDSSRARLVIQPASTSSASSWRSSSSSRRRPSGRSTNGARRLLTAASGSSPAASTRTVRKRVVAPASSTSAGWLYNAGCACAGTRIGARCQRASRSEARLSSISRSVGSGDAAMPNGSPTSNTTGQRRQKTCIESTPLNSYVILHKNLTESKNLCCFVRRARGLGLIARPSCNCSHRPHPARGAR